MIRASRTWPAGPGFAALLLPAALLVLSACGGAGATAQPTAPDGSATPPAVTTTPTPAVTPTPGIATMHIAVANDTCTYDGPMTVPYGPFDIAFDVSPDESDLYFLLIVTLEQGKTGADVVAAFEADGPASPDAAASANPDEVYIPSWLTRLATFGMRTPGTSEVLHQNVASMGAYKDGPLWVLCFRPERMLGTFGPIEVTGA